MPSHASRTSLFIVLKTGHFIVTALPAKRLDLH
jgi:hypothetical protein